VVLRHAGAPNSLRKKSSGPTAKASPPHNRGRGSGSSLTRRSPMPSSAAIMRETFCPAIDHCASRDTVYSIRTHRRLAHYEEWPRSTGLRLASEGVVAKRADSLNPTCIPKPILWVKHRWKW
jgi:hypothetical protein